MCFSDRDPFICWIVSLWSNVSMTTSGSSMKQSSESTCPPPLPGCQTSTLSDLSPSLHRANQLAKYRDPNNLQECHAVLSPPLSAPSPSTGPAVSAKLPSGVSEREQLRFTNNDEACHASFSIRHGGPGGAVGRAVLVFFIKASSLWNTPPTGLFTAPRSSAAPPP